MSYLNLDFDFFDHPKTRRLRGIVGHGAETYILRIWAHCGKFHPDDGILSGYSVPEIEEIAGWKGESGKCLEALLKVGMLELCQSTCLGTCSSNASEFKVHDWEDHQGHISMLKDRAKAGARARWGKKRDLDAQALPKQFSSNASGNAPFLSLPIHTLPKTKDKPLFNGQLFQQFKDRLSAEFKRKPLLIWPRIEEEALIEICGRPDAEDELDELIAYRKRNKNYFPQSIEKLLTAWDKTLDQSRNQEEEPQRNMI